MHYIKSTPNADGNYGNPHNPGNPGDFALPDELLSAYIGTMGFATLKVDDGAVTAVEVNRAAYDAYQAEHPAGPELSIQERIAELKSRLTATDYQAIKYAEGWISDEEYAPIKVQRQAWRDEINKLEAEV